MKIGPSQNRELRFAGLKAQSPKKPTAESVQDSVELSSDGSQLHKVKVPFKGSSRTLEVRIGAKLANLFEEKNVKLDLPRAELITSKGQRAPLVKPDGDSPWTFLDPQRGFVGLPTTEVQLVLSDAGKVQVKAAPPFEPEFDIFRNRPFSVAPPTPEMLGPMEDTTWLSEPMDASGAHIYGASPETREKAAQVFQDVCGKKAEAWPLVEPKLQAEKQELETHLQALQNGGPTETTLATHALGTSDPQKALAQGMARRARLEQRLYQPMIFVMPDDQHWTSLPFLKDSQESLLSDPSGRSPAAILGTDAGWMIFVPESDLDNGGFALKHELYHLLENKYLNDDERAIIDTQHARTKDSKGPFQSTYGHQRDEFFTTLSEEFEGEWGGDGRDWLEQHHSPVLELMREATGR